jgi:GT2 family glycosyltransferase
MKLPITVVCCSANRPKLLDEFLQRWVGLNLQCDLKVIENSADISISQSLAKKYNEMSNIDVIYSSPNGLSRARNMGLSISKTEFVAFTDDDCILGKNWLEEILEAFKAYNADVVTGPIIGVYPDLSAPSFLTPLLEEALALKNFGKRNRVLEASESVFGANMAFKRSSLAEVKFNEQLGRTGRNLLSGEDSEFQEKLRSKHLIFAYAAHAKIYHQIERERLEPEWFIKRFAWQGVTDSIISDLGTINYNKIELVSRSRKLGVEELVNSIFDKSTSDLEDRAIFVRALICDLLTREDRSLPPVEIDNSPIWLPINPYARTVICDYRNYHDFIGIHLSNASTSLYLFEGVPWYDNLKPELENFRDAILEHGEIERVLFSSVDPFLPRERYVHLSSFMNSVGVSFAGMVHRIPADSDQLSSLRDFSQRAKLFCPSSKIVDELLRCHVKVSFSPVIGNLFASPDLARNSSGETFTFGIFGEVRDEEIFSLIQKVLTYKEVIHTFKFKFVGGYKDDRMIEKLRALREEFPDFIDLELCRSYKPDIDNGYRVIAIHEYARALREVNAVIKLQIVESLAASAVVQDAYSQGTPVIALRNTESGEQVFKVTPTLLLTEFSPGELKRVKDEVLKLKSIGEHVQKSWFANKANLENLVSTF